MKKCSTDYCNGDQKTAGLCANCYQRMHYWLKKTPREVMRRIDKLKVYEAQMNTLAPATPIRRRSKA